MSEFSLESDQLRKKAHLIEDPDKLHDLASFTHLHGESLVELKLPINISKKEKQLFDFLISCCEFQLSNKSDDENIKVTKCPLRVAGGWVRDKLLGLESHDLDLALEDVSGIEFAEMINDSLKRRGMEQSHIAVIQVDCAIALQHSISSILIFYLFVHSFIFQKEFHYFHIISYTPPFFYRRILTNLNTLRRQI